MTSFGLQLPDFSWIVDAEPATTITRLRDVAEATEQSGFSSLWVMDHLMQLPPLGGPQASILEGYITLGALAGMTKTVELGTLVTGVTYRNPAHLAKQIVSLDALTGGRIILGIGAAWYDVEHEAYGWKFPPVKERFELLNEAVTICRGMFDNETFSFAGKHFTTVDARVVPRPQRRIPIMIGGSGEKKTLRMVAEMADMCNISGTANLLSQKLAILDEHCAAVGRNPRDIKRTAMVSLFLYDNDGDRDFVRELLGYDSNPEVAEKMIISTRSEAVERLAAMAEVGADEIIVNLPLIKSVDAIHAAAEALNVAVAR